MFLIDAFKKTSKLIRKKRWLFLVLFFTQLVFLILFFLVQFKYQVAMAENFKDIVVPLETANYNSSQLQMGTSFLQDINQISTAWENLKTNFQYLLILSFLVFIIFNGFNWSLSHYLVKKQNLFKIWANFIVVSFIFFVPCLILNFTIAQTPLFQLDPIASAQLMIGLSAIFAYFAFVAFAFLDLKIKMILKKTLWQIGFKKFYWVLLIYLIIFVTIASLTYLLYYSLNFWHISLVTLFIILLILFMNISRIYLITFFSKIS